jgi:hypothetical protein
MQCGRGLEAGRWAQDKFPGLDEWQLGKDEWDPSWFVRTRPRDWAPKGEAIH